MTLLIRWTCCPPQGAHTSHLRTLSKIEFLRGVSTSALIEHFVRESRLLYNHFRIRQHLFEDFSKSFAGVQPLNLASGGTNRGGRIIHPIFDSSTPAKRLFRFALPTTRKVALCRTAPFPAARRRAANRTTNSRFVKPRSAALFACAERCVFRAMRQPNELARTSACRSAADARRQRRACARGPRPRRRRCAPLSR